MQREASRGPRATPAATRPGGAATSAMRARRARMRALRGGGAARALGGVCARLLGGGAAVRAGLARGERARGRCDDAELGHVGGAGPVAARSGCRRSRRSRSGGTAGWRMLARWPGEFIQAAMIARGVARSPVPQARFSPIRQAPPPTGSRRRGCARRAGSRRGPRGRSTGGRPCPRRARARRAAAARSGFSAVRPRAARSALSRQKRGVGDRREVGRVRAAASALAQAVAPATPSLRFGAWRSTRGSIARALESSLLAAAAGVGDRAAEVAVGDADAHRPDAAAGGGLGRRRSTVGAAACEARGGQRGQGPARSAS